MNRTKRTPWSLASCLGLGLVACLETVLGAPAVEVQGVVPGNLPPAATATVVVPIPAETAGRGSLRGRIEVGGRPAGEVVLQAEPADAASGTPERAWFQWTPTRDQLGQPIVLRIAPRPPTGSARAYRVRYADPNVEVATADGGPVLAYRHGAPDPSFKYPMTSYLHPLVGLDGEILTDCTPSDHLHHRGLFWAWVRIQRGEDIIAETWVPRNLVLEAGDLKTATGPVFARFAARHYYVYRPESGASQPASVAAGTPAAGGAAGLSRREAGERLFDEWVVCRVFPVTDGGRAIDVELTLTALQDGLKIGGQTQSNKGYGGLTLRFSTEQQGKAIEPRIVADGKAIQRDLNHVVARWIDWTGIFNGPDGKRLGHRSGAAVLVHPSHPPMPGSPPGGPASPPEWITRFYGPINVAYPGLEMLAMPRGKPLHLRYRLWVHRGDTATADVDGRYRGYAADWKWTGVN
ncbi:MAG: PmoA family protein [Planctomycetes bacterium]|nr:PmoA family protein [Planctomycetota bacterium]